MSNDTGRSPRCEKGGIGGKFGEFYRLAGPVRLPK